MKNTSFQFLLSLAVLADWKYLFSSLHKIFGALSKTPFAFSFSQEEIDTVLRFGSNTDDHRKRIAAEFMKQKSLDENADFLRRIYHGGNGFIIDANQE